MKCVVWLNQNVDKILECNSYQQSIGSIFPLPSENNNNKNNSNNNKKLLFMYASYR